jgi:hypothetical protein
MSEHSVSPEVPSPAFEFDLRGDPIVTWLTRWRWGLPVLVGGVVGWGLLHTLGLPWLYGHWRTVNGIEGAAYDWPMLVIVLFMVPALIGYYARQPALIRAMQAGVLERVGGQASAEERQALRRWLGRPGWTWAAVGVGALQVLSSVNDLRHLASPTWESVNAVMIGSLQPLRFITFYVLVLILVRHVLALINLNHLITTLPIEIAPLHPDGAGGLRPLGDYAFSFGLLAMVVSLNFGMTLLRAQANPGVLTAEFYGELVFYLAAGPLLFFLPLWNVHTRMAAAKRRLLAEIAEQFDQEYRVLLDGLRRDVLDAEGVTRMEAVQKIYHITRAAPEWPFDLAVLSEFGAVVFLPVLAPLGVTLLASWLASR